MLPRNPPPPPPAPPRRPRTLTSSTQSTDLSVPTPDYVAPSFFAHRSPTVSRPSSDVSTDDVDVKVLPAPALKKIDSDLVEAGIVDETLPIAAKPLAYEQTATEYCEVMRDYHKAEMKRIWGMLQPEK
jgi:hypothetical protein